MFNAAIGKDFDVDFIALTSIAKRISGTNDVLIQFVEQRDLVYTDCRCIYLPNYYMKDIKSSQGLIAHEAGHIGYGSFELSILKLKQTLTSKYQLSYIIVEKILNVIEDVRVDLINKKKFPGFFENLADLTKKKLPEVKHQMKLQEDFITYIYLYFEGFSEFCNAPEFRTTKFKAEDWKAISMIYEFLSQSKTSAASIICCDLMCKILKKYFTEEKKHEMEKSNRINEDRLNFTREIERDPYDHKKGEKSELEKISQKIIDRLKSLELQPEDLGKILEQAKKLDKELADLKKKSEKGHTKSGSSSREFNKGDFKAKLTPKKIWKEGSKNENVIESIAGLIKNASDLMKERMIKLEYGDKMQKLIKGSKKRKIIDTTIEKENMEPVGMLYRQIKQKYSNTIKKLKLIFENLKTTPIPDDFQKSGRFNNKLIKAVTSNYKFRQCFTRKTRMKELKMLLLVDISGSMNGPKQRSAKLAMVILSEALEEIAKVRIVLFTGSFDAVNILVKDFDEKLNLIKIDKYGRHRNYGENLDGVSIKHEAEKVPEGTIIIVVSDGQPAGISYGLYDAIPDIQYVRKKFKTFAFSIDASGEYLRQLYGKDWILTNSYKEANLAENILNLCQLIAKEFYR